MNILNIIDTIYESRYFPTLLTVSIIVLVFLFIVVIILGIRDKKKSSESKKENVQELKDITFDTPTEKDVVKEDVTFEIPVLTKNLENFKKSLEEEIEREEKINVIKTTTDSIEKEKTTKILDQKEIDNTDVIPIIKKEIVEPPKKENRIEPEEEPRPPKREILKELFKDRKPKEIETPKIKETIVKDELPKPVLEKEVSKKENTPQTELPKQIKKVDNVPKETKYSGDDDF